MDFALRTTSYEGYPSMRHDVLPSNPVIGDLIAEYTYVETLCEEAIARLEELTRKYYSIKLCRSADEMVAVKSGEIIPRSEMSASDIPFKDFRHLYRLAEKLVPDGLPNANRRFTINACSLDFIEIDDLENTIMAHQSRMNLVEQEILDTPPLTPVAAVEKLKFMSVLMLDNHNLEVDYFAYLVEECAHVIARELIPRDSATADPRLA
ncbi:MAG: hypothetical protein H3C51_05665 [Rubellimicrobium sp.]|nr:hypothetical protein [Rubellimicrobium sp.]